MGVNFKMEPDAVYMVPLGGCGVFGANMTLYGWQDQWIMVDCGMGFADDTMPGVDILLPDPAFAQSLGDKLLAIVLTHGHEDHIGAIGHLWPRLKKKMYATPFTAARIRQTLNEQSWGRDAAVQIVDPDQTFSIGGFSLRFIRMAHSIPEAFSIAFTLDHVGTWLHTGDWKMDPDPVEGHVTDVQSLKDLGDRGVLAVVGDSTNAMVPGHSASEGVVQKNLIELLGEFETKIIISCFSTNVARLHSIQAAAASNKRRVCLAGRSLRSIDEVARKTGYLKDTPDFLTEEEALHMPDRSLVYVATGSQGEPRAALSRIAAREHPRIRVKPKDVVIFSSRGIPGNERAIDRIKNRFYAMGVNVVTDRDAPVHASGHPYREELKELYALTRPKIVIPVHGEAMQQERHAALAKECGVPEAIIPSNGKVIEVSKDGARIVGDVPHGVLAVEAGRIVHMDHEAILTRRRMMYHGSAVVTAVVDEDGNFIADPKVTALGLLDENSEIDGKHIRDVVKEIKKQVKNIPRDMRRSDEALSEEIRVMTRRFFAERFDRKPQTRVHLVRV